MNPFLALFAGLARRGAGGGFVSWGITPPEANNKAHGLGALLVAATLCVQHYTLLMLPIWALGWFFFTKPTPHWCFRTIDHPNAYMRALWYGLASVRMAYVLPLAVCVYVYSHGFYLTPQFGWFAMLSVLALPYYVGGVLYRDDRAVVFGEWGYCVTGLMMWGLGSSIPAFGWVPSFAGFVHHLTGL